MREEKIKTITKKFAVEESKSIKEDVSEHD